MPAPTTSATRRRLAALVLAAVVPLGATACSGSSPGAAGGSSTPNSKRSTTTTTTLATADACRPARTASEADRAAGPRTFAFDGQDRRYLLALPADYDGRHRTPVLFDFHGWGGSKEKQEATTRLGARGTARGFIVVTPDALGDIREFNMFASKAKADDYGFVHALLGDLRARWCVDPDRVFAAGHSNGSAFTGFLSCRAPYEFAAVAMVSATIPSSCPAGQTPSVLAIAGTADPQVPYDGGSVGGGPTNVPPARQTFTGYLAKYRCGDTPARTKPAPGVTEERGTGCRADARVVLVSVADGTHPWPGSPAAAADPANSAAGRSYDATGAILDFFEQTPR